MFLYPKFNRTTKCLQIYVGSTEVIDHVFCSNTSKNQWLLIQNRQTGSTHFNRSWNEYRRGFGRVTNQSDFWIGNENLHWLTTIYSFRLKIELTNWHNETRRAIYEKFHVANKNDHYRLFIDDYHGDMDLHHKFDSSSLLSSFVDVISSVDFFSSLTGFSRWHCNARFSTYDHYVAESQNCSQIHGGAGWWYHYGSECAHVQLNGQLSTQIDGFVPFNTGILWIGWRNERHYSFKRVNMAIQRKSKTKSS